MLYNKIMYVFLQLHKAKGKTTEKLFIFDLNFQRTLFSLASHTYFAYKLCTCVPFTAISFKLGSLVTKSK